MKVLKLLWEKGIPQIMGAVFLFTILVVSGVMFFAPVAVGVHGVVFFDWHLALGLASIFSTVVGTAVTLVLIG